MACLLSMVTPFNDALAGWQHLRYGRRIEQSALAAPPIFIIGHWRSGTTFLHELMMLDSRNVCPNTYQCFAPNHFLVSEWFFHRFGNWMLPSKRPMDNVIAGWDRPQEDEFALMNIGLPSPYRRMAFPKNSFPDMNYLDFEGVPAEALERWREGLEWFLRAVSTNSPGRIVLKSPTHTGRVGFLAKHFPGAKFIHITRDPRSLFPSTMRLWFSLDAGQSMQQPPPPTSRQYVLDCFRRMYTSFHRDREQLPPGHLLDIRYEELVADPMETMEKVYRELQLGDFAPVVPPLNDWIQNHHRGYQPNQHHLPAEDEAAIQESWSDYFERYGY